MEVKNLHPIRVSTACAFFLMMLLAALQSRAANPTFSEYEVLIKFDESIVPLDIEYSGNQLVAGITWIDSIGAIYGVDTISTALHYPPSLELASWYLIRYDSPVNVPSLVSFYKSKSEVLTAEPNSFAIEFLPNDGLFGNQWYHETINTPEVWDDGDGVVGDEDVVIAIIEGGRNIRYSDIWARVEINDGEEEISISNNQLHRSGQQIPVAAGEPPMEDWNGYENDRYGWDFDGEGLGDNNVFDEFQEDNDPPTPDFYSRNNHGTWVSSIAAAQTNNSIGIAGVAGGWSTDNQPSVSGARLLHLKCHMSYATQQDRRASATQVADALFYAYTYGVDNNKKVIVNMSFGLWPTPFNAFVENVVNYITADSPNRDNILLVAAVGNNNSDDPIFYFPPAHLPGVMGIAGTNQLDQKYVLSNFNEEVDMCAPGERIYGAHGDGINPPYFGEPDGTSASAPMVAGAAALLWSSDEWDDLTSRELWLRLRGTATSLTETEPVYYGKLGAGRLDIQAAMVESASPRLVLREVQIVSESGDEYIFAGESATLEIKLKNFWEPTGSVVTATLMPTISEVMPEIGHNQRNYGVLDTDESSWGTGDFGILTLATAETDTYFVTLRVASSGGYQEDLLVPIPVYGRPMVPIEIPDHDGFVFSMVMDDVDEDDQQELIWGTQYDIENDHALYMMEPDGSYVTADIEAGWDIMTRPAIGDIDNDGHKEIVAIANLGNQSRLYTWRRDLTTAYPHIQIAQASTSDAVLADLNLDGKLDIVFCTKGQAFPSQVRAFTYSSSINEIVPLWEEPITINGRITVTPAVGNITGSFVPEIVVCASNPMSVTFLNGSDGDLLRTVTAGLQGTMFRAAPVIADLSKCDGEPEVLLSTISSTAPTLSTPFAQIYSWGDNAIDCTNGPQSSSHDAQDQAVVHFTQSVVANVTPGLPIDLETVTMEASTGGTTGHVFNPLCVVETNLTELDRSMHSVVTKVNSDDLLEIIGCGFHGPSYAPQWGSIAGFDATGARLDGWYYPYCDISPFQTSPIVGDWDGDGSMDIVFLAAGQGIRVYKLDTGEPFEPLAVTWNQENVDERNSGLMLSSASGVISTPSVVTWSGRVSLNGDVVVQTGAKLNILAGTIVYCELNTSIEVLGGTLNVLGEEGDSVYFVAGCDPGWGGIHSNGGYLDINFAHIEDAEIGIHAENPSQSTTRPANIKNTRILRGVLGLGLWGNHPAGYSVDHVTVQDIESLDHHTGIYFLNAKVKCDCLVVQNCQYRTGLIRNTTGSFENCLFTGETENYGLFFDGPVCTPTFQCCKFDHIRSSDPSVLSGITSAFSSPVFGMPGEQVRNNLFVESGGYLVGLADECPCPVFEELGNYFDQQALGDGGMYFNWIEPPSQTTYNIKGNYWNSFPEIDYFQPDDEELWARTPFESEPEFCGRPLPLDTEPENRNPLWVGLSLESDGDLDAAQTEYLHLSTVDTLPLHMRATALARMLGVDRENRLLDENAVTVSFAPLFAEAQTMQDTVMLFRVMYGWETNRGNFEQAMADHENLFSLDLGFEDSLRVALDILEIQLLANSTGGNLDNAIRPARDELVVLGRDDGLRKIDAIHQLLLGRGSPSHTSTIPRSYALYQNYPNPFNPSTDIRFDLPEAIRVELKVFNILGQEVVTLVDDVRAAGAYRILWDGKNAAGLSTASGVYVYQIKTPNFTDAKKMVLLR